MLSLLPSSEFCAAICVRLCIVRVSVNFDGLVSHVFHYWGGRSFVPAAAVGFAFSFVGFALTAIGLFLLADNGMDNSIVSSLDGMEYPFS